MHVLRFKTFFVIISCAFISHVVHYLYHKKKRKPSRKEIHEAILFSYGVGNIGKSKYSRCMITKSMDRLLYYISSPRYTLDVCMYVLTNWDIASSMLKLNLKGVVIRLIIDADMAFSTGSYVRKLENHGIAVRWMKSNNLMHHKFCLIDAAMDDEKVIPLVMIGSLNWTNQALSGNWEDVAVTSQKELVEQYRTEFERLWKLFKPII